MITGDSRFFWPDSIESFARFPSAWDSSLNSGIGQSQLGSLWITSYLNFTAFFTKLGLSWDIISFIFWILPAIILSFFSSFFLFNYLFSNEAGKDKIKYSLLAGIIYVFNTYFLMILTGGQLGVALSYSLAPLVLLTFIRITINPTFRNSFISGLILGPQILFDPRIVYITLFAVFLYLIFNLPRLKTIRNKFSLLLPFMSAFLLNSFWILPLILTKSSSIPTGFDSSTGFKFFSFADFSHSLSMLHPNWPENIFGKIYFLDPKFLLIPIVAFSSLLFTKNKNILYFAFMSLLGIFLAKGSNPPFGEINEFIFSHFPGASMFRDPTKWYILIVISYSILIPISLIELSRYIQSRTKFRIYNLRFTNIFLLLFIFYFLFSITPIVGQAKIHQVPQEYSQLKDFLNDQKTFSRTLWIPKWQRFGYFSNTHPAIGREELLKGKAQKQISELNQNLLRDLSIKYIIVPYDSEGEIFLNDRKYDHSQYLKTTQELENVKWLKKVDCLMAKLSNCSEQPFGKIKVFEVTNPKDHFWSPSENLEIQYKYVNPTKYILNIKNAKKGDVLIFSESFDKYWTLKSQISTLRLRSGRDLKSQKYHELLNSFVLEQNGNYSLEVYYEPQTWVNIGMVISLITFMSILGLIGFGFKRKK